MVPAVLRSAHFGKAWTGDPGRSDVRLKHDIVLLGQLDNGLGLYRFSYNGSSKVYVGVLVPHAVARGTDGYLRVSYEKLSLKFETYDHWIKSGPLNVTAPMQH